MAGELDKWSSRDLINQSELAKAALNEIILVLYETGNHQAADTLRDLATPITSISTNDETGNGSEIP